MRKGEGAARSYWLKDALDREPDTRPEPLRADLRTDICVVGGGYTGLWTALRLKELEPSADVTVIERDICGGGASGRNGGFAMTWTAQAPLLLGRCGAEETVRLIRESEAAVRAIGRFCAEHGIDAGFRQGGWLWTATNRAQLGAWRGVIATLDRLGLHPYEELPPGEVVRRTGSPRHLAGVYETGVATVQPALVARGLRRICVESGVRIHEGTAMLALERGARPAVRTPGGTIRAEKLVLALNAWAHELPEFRRRLLALNSDMIVTEPIPERLATLGLKNGLAVSDSRWLVDYCRATADGRLAYGKGGGPIAFAGRVGDRFDCAAAQADEVQAAMLRIYPGLADVRISATWRGPVGRSASGLPMFGHLPGVPAVVYGHGYGGNGVGPSWIGGRILASLALDRRDVWSACPLVNAPDGPLYPPEPIRSVGARLVRAAIRRKERAEDEDCRPGALDRLLASLAPGEGTVRGTAVPQDGARK